MAIYAIDQLLFGRRCRLHGGPARRSRSATARVGARATSAGYELRVVCGEIIRRQLLLIGVGGFEILLGVAVALGGGGAVLILGAVGRR